MSAPVPGRAGAAPQPLQAPGVGLNKKKNEDDYDSPHFDDLVLATAGYDHTIKFWQAHTGQCTRTIQHTDSQVNALEISHDGQLLAACGYQHIRMYDVHGASASPVVNYEGVSKNVMDVGFQEQGRWIYTGGEDGSVKIWDPKARNLNCQKVFTTNAPVNSVTLHPNQQDLIIGDQNGAVHIWNVRYGNKDYFIPNKGASIQCVAVDAKGKRIAVVTNKGTLHVRNMKTFDNGKSEVSEWKSVQAHKRYALKVKFSPDGCLLATSSADQKAKIWRAADLEYIAELHVQNQRWVWDISFSADSQYLFTASSDNIARLWSLPNKEVKREYVGHQKALTCLAFRDGQAP